jgi:stress-induced morphogen
VRSPGCSSPSPRILGSVLVDDVKQLIEGALPGATVEVIDEGGGDHLRVSVTASQFEGMSRIDQHRLVKNAVRERSDTGELHSLSIKTSVPE